LKIGADSPRRCSAYEDFDGTAATKPQVPLHAYAPHLQDWRPGDPTWKTGKGKGLIGAINYLASRRQFDLVPDVRRRRRRQRLAVRLTQ
jgi:hypothetical protein